MQQRCADAETGYLDVSVPGAADEKGADCAVAEAVRGFGTCSGIVQVSLVVQQPICRQRAWQTQLEARWQSVPGQGSLQASCCCDIVWALVYIRWCVPPRYLMA